MFSLIMIIAFVIIIEFLENANYERKKYKTNYQYYKKNLMTKSEKEFYNKIKTLEQEIPVKIIPQVNLAAIIDKKGNSKYRNELFRNIDFGIFDQDLNDILLLVELNDSTHFLKKRKKRDESVKRICVKSNIKLITFYTNKPNEIHYVCERIKNEIITRQEK